MSVYQPEKTAQPGIRDVLASHAEHIAGHGSEHECKQARHEIAGAASQWRDLMTAGEAPDEAIEYALLVSMLAGDATPVSEGGMSDTDALRILAKAGRETDPAKASAILKDGIPSFTA